MTKGKYIFLLFDFLFLVLIGVADYLTGYEMHFGMFYLIPILLAAWRVGRVAGVLFAIISDPVWITADIAGGHHYTHTWLIGWNAFNRLVVFSSIAFIMATLKNTADKQRRLIISLHDSIRNLSRLNSLLPICCVCHRWRDDDGYKREVEQFAGRQSPDEPAGGVCQECVKIQAERLLRDKSDVAAAA